MLLDVKFMIRKRNKVEDVFVHFLAARVASQTCLNAEVG